jgi:hypothetical protein
VKRCERCWRLPEVCLCCPDCGSMGECECGKPVPADRDAAQGREVPEAIKEAAERIFQAAYGSGALARRGLLLVAKDELLAAFAAGQRSASEAQPPTEPPQETQDEG